jgi:hypothetical protein
MQLGNTHKKRPTGTWEDRWRKDVSTRPPGGRHVAAEASAAAAPRVPDGLHVK